MPYLSPAGPVNAPYRLGKAPAEPSPKAFSLWNYINPTAQLPQVPEHFRHADPPKWIDILGRQYGVCVWNGAANESRLWEHEGGLETPEFTADNIMSMYKEVAGFDPKNLKTDRGTSVKEAASYRRLQGIVDAKGNRHKVDAYAWVSLRAFSYLKVAIWTLGGVGLGFRFPAYAMDQFKAGKAWSLQKGKVEGGHYVPAIGIAPNSGNIICVSWGQEIEMTRDFYMEYADEVVGWIDLDRLAKSTRLSPENFNEQRIRHDLELVASGRVYALNQEPTMWA